MHLQKIIFRLAAATFGVLVPAEAIFAADLPLKANQIAVGSEQGIYLWIDGSYQQIRLPHYGLGFRRVDDATQNVLGTFDAFDPNISGGGISGGVGYLLPHAPTLLGSDLRIEFAGSYVKASATQTGGTSLTTPTGPAAQEAALQLINGAVIPGAAVCFSPVTCTTTASLSTDYSAWQLSGRVAGDYRFGIVSLTPSFGVFGGNSHNNQTFTQTFQRLSDISPLGSYSATTSLKWTDLGARLGLEGKVAIHPWITVGLGGTVGWADRQTNFTGNDTAVGLFPGASSLGTSATKSAFLANAEASLTVKPGPAWSARAFIGLNFDDSVPGLSTPTWTGSTIPNSVTPTGIVYAKETSYYAGGGVTYKFGGTDVARY